MNDNTPNADELAQRGEKRRKKKADKKAKLQAQSAKKNAQYQKVLDQKRVFRHVSRWYRWRQFFLWLIILSLFSALPFIFMLAMVENSNYEFMVPVFAIPFTASIVLYIIASKMIRASAIKEKEWIEDLPFDFKGYPDFFVYRSYSVFDVTVEFERKVPDHEYFMNVFGTLPYEIEHEQSKKRKDLDAKLFEDSDIEQIETMFEMLGSDVENTEDSKHYKFEVSNPSGSKFDGHRKWAYKWIHKACETHFKAIHEQYPIKSVIIGNGTKELDFEWWIPLKQKGFMFMQ